MSVLDVTSNTWEKEILQSDVLVLVDFWHKRCGWCKMLEPIYNEVADEYKEKIKFARLNTLESQENQRVAVEYGVMGTPTLIFFCDGRSVGVTVGFQTKQGLKKLIEEMIDKHRECIEKSTELTK